MTALRRLARLVKPYKPRHALHAGPGPAVQLDPSQTQPFPVILGDPQ